VLNYFGAMEYKSEHWKEDAMAAGLSPPPLKMTTPD